MPVSNHLMNWKTEVEKGPFRKQQVDFVSNGDATPMAAEEQCIKYFTIQHSLFIAPFSLA